MMKRVGLFAMLLASLVVFHPQAAQARERDEFRHNDRREERRDWQRDRRAQEFRQERREDWRARERYDRREYRNEYRPYNDYRYVQPYCPRW